MGAYVQSASHKTAGGATSSVTFTVTAGNLIVICASANNATNLSASNFSDSKSQTYSLADGPVKTTFNDQSIMVYHANAAGGSTTFTFTPPSSCDCDIAVFEISGADTSTPLGEHNSHLNSSNSTTIDCGTITTTTANGVVVCTGSNDGNTSALGGAAGFTKKEEILTSANMPIVNGYQVVTSTGTYHPVWTGASGSLPSVGCVALFKDAAGGTTYNQTVSATTASSTTVAKSAGKRVAATAASSTSVVKQTGKNVSASSASAATVAKQAGKKISTSSATVAAVARQVGKTVGAQTASVGSIVKQVGKNVSTSTASAATVVKSVGKKVSASTGSAATLSALKVKLVTLTATVGTSATISRQVGKGVAAVSATSTTVSKQVSKSVTAVAASVAATAKRVGKSLAASVASSSTLSAIFVSPSGIKKAFVTLVEALKFGATVRDTTAGGTTLAEKSGAELDVEDC